VKIAPVRIAIVGSGAMGALHARVVSQSMEAELACVIDPDREAGEALAERWRSRWFADLDSFRGIDALIVASPTGSHVEWATRALNEGKPVLVEKPIAEKLSDVDTLLDLARRVGVPLSCGLLERFNSAIVTAVEIVESPTHVVTVRHSPYLPRIASGVAYDLLIHDVDFMLRLAGSMPQDVTAHFSYAHPYSQPEAEDVIEASLQFDGMLASLSASRISQRKLRSLVIYELERMIEVDLVRQDITVYRHVGADFLEDGGHGYRQQTVMEIPVVQNAREPLVSQLEHFVALASGEVDATEELESLRAPHAVVAKIVEAGRSNSGRAAPG
jgi:predicted dehydrogenase